MHENDGVFGDEINVCQEIASADGRATSLCNEYARMIKNVGYKE